MSFAGSDPRSFLCRLMKFAACNRSCRQSTSRFAGDRGEVNFFFFNTCLAAFRQSADTEAEVILKHLVFFFQRPNEALDMRESQKTDVFFFPFEPVR